MGRRLLLLTILATARIFLGDDAPVSFERQVAPILVRRCVACHGVSKAFANFRVDTFARLMAGSDAGKSIEPGKPDESLFLDLIVLTEPTGRMPKNANPLPDDEVKTLRRWIEQGARSGGIEPDADLEKVVAKKK
jgi:mono/diheme cytochrome c family protein